MAVLTALLTEEDIKQIPPRYRWIIKLFLKLPNPKFPFFLAKRLPWLEGILWAIILPIVLTLYFFSSIWLFAFLSLNVGFPLNIMVWFLIPALIFILFLRIQLERTIVLWKQLRGSLQEWDVSKSVEEFVKLIRKQKRQN